MIPWHELIGISSAFLLGMLFGALGAFVYREAARWSRGPHPSLPDPEDVVLFGVHGDGRERIGTVRELLARAATDGLYRLNAAYLKAVDAEIHEGEEVGDGGR